MPDYLFAFDCTLSGSDDAALRADAEAAVRDARAFATRHFIRDFAVTCDIASAAVYGPEGQRTASTRAIVSIMVADGADAGAFRDAFRHPDWETSSD